MYIAVLSPCFTDMIKCTKMAMPCNVWIYQKTEENVPVNEIFQEKLFDFDRYLKWMLGTLTADLPGVIFLLPYRDLRVKSDNLTV
jgi:hypothetical protein